MRKFFLVLIFAYLILFFPLKTFAQSDYVLPYPSFMPGSKIYVLQEIKNSLLKYWYFGNFGQFTYSLKQSDKFLVEAKTLFEYKQYLLAGQALDKSNFFFEQTFIFLSKAELENKDISQKKEILKNASIKHKEILTNLEKDLPESFVWSPEKSSPTKIEIKQNIKDAIEIRERGL